jgi:TonB family protein
MVGRLDNPYWAQTPSWAEMQAAFPAAAKVPAGSAVLRCALTAEAHPQRCVILSEQPRKQGFGQAALSLAPRFTVGSFPGESFDEMSVDIPFNFTRTQDGAPPPLVRPRWNRIIGLAEARALYPAKATQAGVAKGEARLKRQLTAQGQLTRCEVLSESLSELDFGEAALETARHMAVNPWNDASRSRAPA